MGGELAGGGAKTYQTEIYYRIVFLLFQMLSLSKQRKCWPFLKLCLGDQTKQTKIYYRIVHFYYLKGFQLLLKRKGNARLFKIWLGRLCRNPSGEPAGGTGRLSFLPSRGQRRNLHFRMRLQLLTHAGPRIPTIGY